MSRLPSRLLLQPMLLAGSLSRLFAVRGYPANPRRILIAHHLLLGDTLMLAALLAKLRGAHPEAEIVMSCPKAIVPLFAARPWGIRAVPYDPRDVSTLGALWREGLPRGGFDLAFVPGDSRHSLLARALGARHVVAQEGDRPAYKNWFVDEQREWPVIPAALPEIFAGMARGAPPSAFRAQDWPLVMPAPFECPSAPYAVLHLGASSPLKLWPAERWSALADALMERDITPVWSAGRGEEALVASVDPAARHHSYAGRLDLLQLAHLLRGASLLVCPDTGIAHLGRIVATPTITLFGPGSDILCANSGFFRDMPGIALSETIGCRDQQTLFRRRIAWVMRCGRSKGDALTQCPRAVCMEALGTESVLVACGKLIENPSSKATS